MYLKNFKLFVPIILTSTLALSTSYNINAEEEVSCDNIRNYLDCTSTGRQEDIIFVFDTTSSMTDEITAMQTAVINFSKIIADAGINYNLGLTEYKDFPNVEAECGEPNDMPYNIYNEGNLTNSVNEMGSWISSLTASGGNNIPESLLSALAHTIADQNWRSTSHRVAIIISDSIPHPDNSPCNEEGNTISAVIEQLRLAGVITHVIGVNAISMLNLAQKTGGSFFNIEDIRSGERSLNEILITIADLISCTYRINSKFSYQDDILSIETSLLGAEQISLPHINGKTQLSVTACRQDGTICNNYELTPKIMMDETVYKHTADASIFNNPAQLTDFSTLVQVCDFSVTTTATLHIGECVAGVTPRPNEPELNLLVDNNYAEVSWATDPFARGYSLLYAPYSCPINEITFNNISLIPLGLQTKIGASLASGTDLYIAVQASNCSGDSSIDLDMNTCSGSSSFGELHIP
ncbi:MAG: VWA domain-containing protein [Thiomargarita sp.]|nr:VWA domain-containing protein [Thiomargarita sp.]